jgi:hypothetical protein
MALVILRRVGRPAQIGSLTLNIFSVPVEEQNDQEDQSGESSRLCASLDCWRIETPFHGC